MKLTRNILAPLLLTVLIALNASYWTTKKAPLEFQAADYQWSCSNEANRNTFNTITITVTQYTLAQYLFETICQVNSDNAGSIGNNEQPPSNIEIRWLPINKIIAQGNNFQSDLVITESNHKAFFDTLKYNTQWIAFSPAKPLYLKQKANLPLSLVDKSLGIAQEYWVASKQSLTDYLRHQGLTLSDIRLSFFENDEQLQRAWELNQISAMITRQVPEKSNLNDLSIMGSTRHWLGIFGSRLQPNTACSALFALSHYFSTQSTSASLCVNSQ